MIDDDVVRTACAQALARLGQRHHSEVSKEVAQALIQAIEDPKYNKVDQFTQRTGHDYAFDSLWMLITEEEVEPYYWFYSMSV